MLADVIGKKSCPVFSCRECEQTGVSRKTGIGCVPCRGEGWVRTKPICKECGQERP